MIVVVNDGDEQASALADHTLLVPETDELLAPVVDVVPLQLFSYYVATARHCDIDHGSASGRRSWTARATSGCFGFP